MEKLQRKLYTKHGIRWGPDLENDEFNNSEALIDDEDITIEASENTDSDDATEQVVVEDGEIISLNLEDDGNNTDPDEFIGIDEDDDDGENEVQVIEENEGIEEVVVISASGGGEVQAEEIVETENQNAQNTHAESDVNGQGSQQECQVEEGDVFLPNSPQDEPIFSLGETDSSQDEDDPQPNTSVASQEFILFSQSRVHVFCIFPHVCMQYYIHLSLLKLHSMMRNTLVHCYLVRSQFPFLSTLQNTSTPEPLS